MRFSLYLRVWFTIALLVASQSTFSAAQATAAGPDRVRARIELVVNRLMGEREIPGAAVAVLLRDSIILMRGFGVADRERSSPVTPQTVFQIASLTKPFTATAVLLLAEDGKVDLAAPALKYLPWLPERYAAVTVRQLLHHTAGVAPDMRRENVDEMTAAEFQRRFRERPASFAPGTRWEYANAGYTLLSQIVEHVSGRTFGDFLESRIFAPLGMVHTGYRVPMQTDLQHAVGYDLVDGVRQRAPHVFSGWGNSGIESTIADLARWAQAMHRGGLLSPSSYRAMFTPGSITGDTALNFPFRSGRSGYGLGWFLMSERTDSIFTHGGAIAGFSSVLSRLPGRGWTIIVLSNMKQGGDRQGQAEAIGAAILDVLRSEASRIAIPTPGGMAVSPDSVTHRAFYEEWHFAPARVVGDAVYLSGVVAVPSRNDPLPLDSVRQEASYRRAWQRIRASLEAAGSSTADIVEMTTFHVFDSSLVRGTKQQQIDAFRRVKDEFVGAPYPAWTGIGVASLFPDRALVEIKVIARRSLPGGS